MKIKLCVIALMLVISNMAIAQTAAIRKMVTDDKGHINKADTSVIVDNDTVYRKIINVSYQEVNLEKITFDFESKMRLFEQQKKEQKESMDRLQMEINQLRNFYNKAKKDFKVATNIKIEDAGVMTKQTQNETTKKQKERELFIEIPDKRNIIRK